MNNDKKRRIYATKVRRALRWALAGHPDATRTKVAAVLVLLTGEPLRRVAWCIGRNPSSLCRAVENLRKSIKEQND